MKNLILLFLILVATSFTAKSEDYSGKSFFVRKSSFNGIIEKDSVVKFSNDLASMTYSGLSGYEFTEKCESVPEAELAMWQQSDPRITDILYCTGGFELTEIEVAKDIFEVFIGVFNSKTTKVAKDLKAHLVEIRD